MSQKIQLRRGPSAARTAFIPDQGEPLWDTDTQRLFIGDGQTPGGIAVGKSSGSGPVFEPALTKLTGGTADALDSLDPTSRTTGEILEILVTQGDFTQTLMTFILNNSAATEDIPNIIKPDTGAPWHWRRVR